MKRTLILSALLLAGGCAMADSFSLTTALPTGSNFTLTMDDGITATLKWGDGTTETFVSNGTPMTTTVKDASLTVSTNNSVTSLYVNDNSLTALNVSNLTKLVALDCNDNEISTLTLTKLTALSTLWCSRNHLQTLNLEKQKSLRKLYASDNNLTSLSLASNELTDLWVDGNEIAGTFDLSTVEKLHSLAVDNNNLDKINLNNSTSAKSAMKFFYASENNLFFNSFPTVFDKTKNTYTVACILAPQSPYYYTYGLNPGTQYDLSDLIRYNAWGVAISPTTVIKDNETGTELVKGSTSDPQDYTMSGSYKYTFNTEHNRVIATVSSAMYPDLELSTKPFAILADLSSIDEIESAVNAGVQTMYDLNGRRIDTKALFENGAPGVYIQNGKKIILK